MITCLIVDDEQHAIDILTAYIQKTPFLNLVFATTNPIEALVHIRQQAIDLIFLDIHLPARYSFT